MKHETEGPFSEREALDWVVAHKSKGFFTTGLYRLEDGLGS